MDQSISKFYEEALNQAEFDKGIIIDYEIEEDEGEEGENTKF